MMKILLIYPSTLSNGKPVKYRKAYLPPLNLAILDRLTEQANPNHKVKIINESIEDIDFDIDCDLVGITALTSQAARAYQISDQFRDRGKSVILGGVHPSLMPHEAIKHADCVVIGEAENLWADILSDHENSRLAQFYQEQNYHDLDNLIIPKWDNMDLSIYRRSFGRKLPRMPIFTTRGCVHACKYCCVSKFYGRSYRYKPISNVLKEIEHTNAESYFFTDDNIICSHDYAVELFKALKSVNSGFRWISQTSTNIIKKPHLIDLASDAGCRSLFFGIESINRNNLIEVKKRFNDPKIYLELYRRCLNVGIQPWFSIIFGFDHDTADSMRATAEFLIKNRIWNVVFWILTPLPGTDLFDEMDKASIILDYDWSKYDLNHVVFKPANFTQNELDENFWKTYQSFYSLPIILKRAVGVFENTDKPIKNVITSGINQFYSRQQIKNKTHPYSMGISRI